MASAAVPADLLAEVAGAAATDSGGVPVELLGDFLDVLCAAVAAGVQIDAVRFRPYRSLGDRAARQGVALRALLDLYTSAAWRLWRHLPAVAQARTPEQVALAGELMLHAVDDAVAALTEGYQLARRALVRSQEAARREFIDDLLGGATDVVSLLHRADGFGLDLSGPYAVATVAAERDFDDGNPLIATLERAILGIKGDAQALLASKEGRLAVVFAAPDRAAVSHVVDQLGRALTTAQTHRTSVGQWRIAVGRPGVGAAGVVTSYRESLDTLDLARRLHLDAQIVDSRELLVYQLLLRDRGALGELVQSTLGPLRDARGGPAALLQTLGAYFEAGANIAASARALHLSVRAVTYRIERIRDLTGLDPTRADDRFALNVAALGARLLDWPTAVARK